MIIIDKTVILFIKKPRNKVKKIIFTYEKIRE